MKIAERFDAIDGLFERIQEHLRALRTEAPAWAQYAFVRHAERVEGDAQKIRNARKVLGDG